MDPWRQELQSYVSVPDPLWVRDGHDTLGGCLRWVVQGCCCPRADGAGVQSSWRHLYVMSWGGLMFIRVGFTAFLALGVVYFFLQEEF